MEPAVVAWGEQEGENPLAVGQRRKTWFATVWLEIWELKSWGLRGSCESQSSRKRGSVTCKKQKPLRLCDPTASGPAASAQMMPSVPTHALDGPCTQGDTVQHRWPCPSFALWCLLESARDRMEQAGPWLQTGASSVPLSCRGRLPVSGAEGRLGPTVPPNPALICPCRSSQGFMHMKLSRTQENKYVLGQHSPPFDSVPEIIHHYASRKLPIKGAEHMSLLYPVAIRTL